MLSRSERSLSSPTVGVHLMSPEFPPKEFAQAAARASAPFPYFIFREILSEIDLFAIVMCAPPAEQLLSEQATVWPTGRTATNLVGVKSETHGSVAVSFESVCIDRDVIDVDEVDVYHVLFQNSSQKRLWIASEEFERPIVVIIVEDRLGEERFGINWIDDRDFVVVSSESEALTDDNAILVVGRVDRPPFQDERIISDLDKYVVRRSGLFEIGKMFPALDKIEPLSNVRLHSRSAEAGLVAHFEIFDIDVWIFRLRCVVDDQLHT